MATRLTPDRELASFQFHRNLMGSALTPIDDVRVFHGEQKIVIRLKTTPFPQFVEWLTDYALRYGMRVKRHELIKQRDNYLSMVIASPIPKTLNRWFTLTLWFDYTD